MSYYFQMTHNEELTYTELLSSVATARKKDSRFNNRETVHISRAGRAKKIKED